MNIYYHQFSNLGCILQSDLVINSRDEIRLKYILHCECNCHSTTKVKVTWVYWGECSACWVVYKVTCKICLTVYVEILLKTSKF